MGGDFDDLRTFAADLAKGVDVAKVRPIVLRGGLNIERQLRAEASGSRHFKMARTITTEMHGDTEVEVGPESRGAGNLAHIAYFGGARGGGGSVPDPQGALDAEAPAFEDWLAKLAEDSL